VCNGSRTSALFEKLLLGPDLPNCAQESIKKRKKIMSIFNLLFTSKLDDFCCHGLDNFDTKPFLEFTCPSVTASRLNS